MRPYLVFGAGAVGSALAAYLSHRGHPVIAVGRPDHVAAIRSQGGLLARSRTGSFLAPVQAVTALPETLAPQAALFLTVQAPDVEAAACVLAPFARTRPLVTWQNGIRAEETAARHAPLVLGGVVRFTTTRLVPGEVRLRAPGELIVGLYPAGRHAEASGIVEDLRSAGFTAAESPDIRADKALKLLVNLVSGPAALLSRTGPEPVLARVQLALLEEAMKIYAAAGIDARPAAGLGPTAAQLRERFRGPGSAPDTAGGIYNSTWQNLHHRRPRLENGFYHGEIVTLGASVGLAAPVNARALALLEETRARGRGPETMDRDTFRARFADLVVFESASGANAAAAGGNNLEI